MREIKFRAWEKDLKEMVYEGELCGYVEYDTNPVKAINLMLNGECGDYVFMQYTGLKDKNGREIYEGDIYQYIIQLFFDGTYQELERRAIVRYEDGAFMVEEYLLAESLEGDVESFIVGNIHENPELLGEDN